MAANHNYRVQRGRVLKIADKTYGTHRRGGVSNEVIALTLNDMHLPASSGVLRGHCEYLMDKGYVEIEEIKDDLGGGYIVTLTAKGVDLLEGNIPADPGVEV